MSRRRAGPNKDRLDDERSTPPTAVALNSTTLKVVIAVVWAVVVGGLMAGGAGILGESAEDVLLIGILGGMGAAVFIFLVAARL